MNKYNGLNGVWDDNKKKFVKPGTVILFPSKKDIDDFYRNRQ